MSQKNSKLLRKISRITNKKEAYVKREYKKMTPPLRVAYLSFIRENIKRLEAFKNTPPSPSETVFLDQKIEKEGK